jgi:hypothetical protein
MFMIWRKLALVKSGQYYIKEDASFEIPYLEEARDIIIKNLKRYEYLSLVIIVKFALQFSNFLKNKSKELSVKIQNIHLKNQSTREIKEKFATSNLLKLIYNYKRKIKRITYKIKQEEKEENNL